MSAPTGPDAAAAAPAVPAEPGRRWLDAAEQETWVTVSSMFLLLPGALDAQLQRDARLSLFEYFVLSRLSMAPERTLRMSELAALANGSLSRLSNVVKRLEQREWLRREPDPDDGRYTLARLTEDGWEQVEAAAPGHVDAVRSLLFDGLTPEQVRQLAAIATQVVARLRPDTSGAPAAEPPGDCAPDRG